MRLRPVINLPIWEGAYTSPNAVVNNTFMWAVSRRKLGLLLGKLLLIGRCELYTINTYAPVLRENYETIIHS
jgi:hypothetical protein